MYPERIGDMLSSEIFNNNPASSPSMILKTLAESKYYSIASS